MTTRRMPILAAVLVLASGASCAGPDAVDDPLASPFEVTAPPATDDAVRSPADLPTLTPVPPIGESAGPTAVAPPAASRIETDWGSIWDALPAGFPVYPSAIPFVGSGDDAPLSAAFAVEETSVETIVGWMQSHLELATYSTVALSGPLEDDAFVIDSVGEAGCRIETTVKPSGGITFISVRYGADCPLDQ